MTVGLIFPGQGSQEVGMGCDLVKNFAVAKALFEEVDETLNEKLSKTIFEGPADKLMLTENAQPALMLVSFAILKVLEVEGKVRVDRDIKFMAGHSLGEYTALTAAKCLTLADTARILKARGRAMQNAVPVGQGAMAVLIGVDLSAAEEISHEAAGDEICVAANDNAPGQIVISGSTKAIERAVELGKKFGAKRAVMLPVSAPFHCDLMEPAAKIMAKVLSEIEFKMPVVPIVSNVTAKPEDDPKVLQQLLVQQVTSRVRWRESVLNMKNEGITTLVEIGAGKVLTGMIKRIDSELTGVSIQNLGDISSFDRLT